MNIGGYIILLTAVAVASFLLGYSFGCSKTLDWVIEMLEKTKTLREDVENGYAEEKEE